MGAICQYYDTNADALTENDKLLLDKFGEKPEDMDRPRGGLPRIVPHRYGFWIYFQWEDLPSMRMHLVALAQVGFSEMFMALYSTAGSYECNWINLDWDA
jgi:hypothetical protein